jgi:hypothetical protein
MKFLTLLSLILSAELCTTLLAWAQMGSQAGLNAAMLKLFGDTTAFSAQAELTMLDLSHKETLRSIVHFALLDGKMRTELDMNQMKSTELSPEDLAGFKKMGLEKMITIVRPDRKSTLVIYPSLKGYAETPMSREQAADLATKFKVEKVLLGKEVIDGHPCEKSKVLLRGDKGEKYDAVVWNATDLNRFPLRIQMNQSDATVLMQFKEIKLTKPEANQFEAPASFARYDSVERLVRAKSSGAKK